MKFRSSRVAAFLLACLFVLGNAAYGEELALPEGLTVIEEAAFAGDTSLSTVVLPEGIREIGSRAFAESSVSEINIPGSVECIAPDAFAGITAPLLIQTAPDSYGVSYALANQLDFRADTVCRALVIGQGDYPSNKALRTPTTDAAAMEAMLSDNYRVTREVNLTADQILSAVSQTFAEAKDSDLSLFYYAGHGAGAGDSFEAGSLIGIDLEDAVSPAQLRAALDGVKGRKIVVVDACYSGNFIARGTAESPAASFIRAFLAGDDVHASSLAAQQYYVFAASAVDELSWESTKGGVFTSAFLESRTLADRNGDGVVTVQECYEYTSSRVLSILAQASLIQNVQVYPENCNWFGLFR